MHANPTCKWTVSEKETVQDPCHISPVSVSLSKIHMTGGIRVTVIILVLPFNLWSQLKTTVST